MRRFSGAMTALLLAMAMAPVPAAALRVVAGSFRVDPPTEVYITRTITLSCEIEEELGVGANAFDYEVTVEPGNAANMISRVMPDLTCTGTGRTRGMWVYQAVTPGPFRFKLTAGILGCRKNLAYSVVQSSSPVEIKPLPVWSGQELTPQVVAPGEEFVLRLNFRNDAPFEVVYAAPMVSPEVFGDFVEIAGPPAPPKVEPASTVDAARRLLILPPGLPVSLTWRYRAIRAGRARFLITGGGMMVTTPVINCRIKGNLSLFVPEPDIPGAVGREYRIRGKLYNTGEARIISAAVTLTWSPEGAARLIGNSFTGPKILDIDEAPLDCLWRLELLQPGLLSLGINAGATEMDSGRLVTASLKRGVRVLSPPELVLRVKMDSATLVVGSRTDFSVIVENRSRGAALNVVPMMTLRQGSGKIFPLTPVYQGIAPGTTAVFRGGLVPSEAGAIELGAQVSASGDREGPRVTAISDPVDLLSLPEPRLRVWTMNDRVYNGGECKARWWVENSIAYPVRIDSIQLTVSGAPANSDSTARLKTGRIILAPGAGATLYAAFKLGISNKTDEISGSASFTGVILPYRQPFSFSLSRRVLALASARISRMAVVGPLNAFNPVRDRFFNVEVVIGKKEEAGLVVMTPEGAVVRTLMRLTQREPGWSPVIWDGQNESGSPVPSGKYVVRLAGPAPAGASWPMDAKWKDDRQLTLERP